MDETTLIAERQELNRAAELLGGQAALASAIGFPDRRHVWPWFNADRRRVPEEHCPAIERATRGEVRCEQLRGDIAWHRVADPMWPWHPEGRPLIDVSQPTTAYQPPGRPAPLALSSAEG